MRTLVVTGATGYVGGALVAAARQRGWRVVAATRRRCEAADAWQDYDLHGPAATLAVPTGAPIVHLAALTRGDSAPRIEVQAARDLLDVARASGSPVVFLSSQVARDDAPTGYGRTKKGIEDLVLSARGIVVRPGLVWGGAPGGVYATLLRAARSAHVWPAIVPAPSVQPVHVDDLVWAVLRVVEEPARYAGRVIRIGEAEPVRFDKWMQALAASRSRRLRTLYVPAGVVRAGAAVARHLGWTAVGARASSLVALAPMPTAEDLASIGLAPRSSLAAFAQRERARAVLREGRALLRYVLGESPRTALLRRYARMVAVLDDGCPLRLANAWLCFPALLRVLDQPGPRQADPAWRWRIRIAGAIAEASPQGAGRFLAAPEGGGRAMRMLAALGGVGLDALARIASVVVTNRR